MFARQAFRSVRSSAPFKSIRKYASEPSGGGGGLGPYAWTAIGAAGVGSLYFGYTQINNANPGLPKPKASSTPGPAPAQFKGGDQGFVLLKLESIENINQNTKKFRFAFEDEKMESGLPVASAVITKYQGPEMEKPVIRPYTPTSDEDTQGHMDFVIKRYPNGPMSEHMHNMAPGQRLDIKGPIPKYPMETNKHRHVAMIAGGTGITPMYQVMRRIFKDPEDKTEVTLVFGNITEDDILLKKELAELENTYPRRFHAVYTLDKPPEGSNRAKGFISKDLLKTVLPEPKEENVKIFVCGPPGLYKAISGTKTSPTDQGELAGALKELGYSQDQVYKF